jgi:periplasmic protein TonB
MTVRFFGAALAAACIAFALTYLMQALIKSELELEEPSGGKIVDFVRLKRERPVERVEREAPRRVEPEKQPPPPDMQLSPQEGPAKLEVAAVAPDLTSDLDINLGPGGGGQGSDADPVPLVRVNPQYPARAMQRGIEGWVQLRFTVTSAGTVKDVEVEKAEPANYFEQAAVNAVSRYKYKPSVVGGKPVETTGVRVILQFNLNRG